MAAKQHNHYCDKESEINEIKQLIKSLSSNEEKVLHNWHDIRILENRVELYEKQYEETLTLIREINECQQHLIREVVKLNSTFTTLKWVIGACAGIITFLITNLIGLI